MNSEPSHIANLLLRLHRDNLSDPLSDLDRQELEAWAGESDENTELYRELTHEDAVQAGLRQLEGIDEAPVRRRILAQMPDVFGLVKEAPVVRIKSHSPVGRWAAAAVILAVLGTGAWWWVQTKQISAPAATTAQRADIVAPAHSRATLTLANGQQVALDSMTSGALAQQGNAQVVKEANGQVAYKVENVTNRELLFNTLSNPRGSQVVNLTLSDGTKVWLNAESSIRYPVVFMGSDRTVEMTGEAYFEVRKNASQPFKVKINRGDEIEVLGTQFDVNAYKNEPKVKTTLIEGSVRILGTTSNPLVGVNTNKGKASVVLKPGEQAQVVNAVAGGRNSNDTQEIKVLRTVDIDEVTAWKNGFFRFNDASIETIMKNAARWYDVEVDYQTDNKLGFVATISRDVPISKLLKLLELTDRVHFKIDGKKITVLP